MGKLVDPPNRQVGRRSRVVADMELARANPGQWVEVDGTWSSGNAVTFRRNGFVVQTKNAQIPDRPKRVIIYIRWDGGRVGGPDTPPADQEDGHLENEAPFSHSPDSPNGDDGVSNDLLEHETFDDAESAEDVAEAESYRERQDHQDEAVYISFKDSE